MQFREDDAAQRKLNIWTGNLAGFAESTQRMADQNRATQIRYIYATKDSNIYVWIKAQPLKKSFRDALSLQLILGEDEAFIAHPSGTVTTRAPSPGKEKRYNLKDSQWPSN